MTTNFNTCRWEYWVRPGTSWAEGFAQNLLSPDIQMWPEETDTVPSIFAWTSPHLNDVSSQQEFVDRTAALKAVFDGAMFLAIGSTYHPFELLHPTACDQADLQFLQGLPYPADVRVEPFSTQYIGQRASRLLDPLNDPVTRSIFLARYDDMTRSILKYTGVQGLSYVTLYAYRDWMKSGGWEDKRIASEAGWTTAKLKDFTNTANNPTYLGPFSRHGGVSQTPKRPMALEEAEAGMKRAMGSFLLDRASTLDLAGKWRAISA